MRDFKGFIRLPLELEQFVWLELAEAAVRLSVGQQLVKRVTRALAAVV